MKPLLAALLLAAAPATAQESAFGCTGIEFNPSLPAVEGKDGVFYRTMSDFRLQHPMRGEVMVLMERLAAALAENGTTLVYATVPAKSLAMPQFLPPRAADYGYDPQIAETVYDDIITRLNAAGITAPDLRRALQAAEPGETVFYPADFHWTSAGARRAAQAIGDAIRAHPAYAETTPATYETRELGIQPAFSGMRRTLQTFCTKALPPVESMSYETTRTDAAPAEGDGDATLDIFATGGDGAAEAPQMVLVGTSFSDSPVNNFAGFLSQYTGLDVVNYSVTGGNQYGAITAYLTSEDFAAARPRFLIWENPIYNNLAQYGTAPLEELVAAAGDGCAVPLETERLDDHTLTASLHGLDPGGADAIFADYGPEGARRVDFTLRTADGFDRATAIERGQRQRATGNFYLGLGAFHQAGIARVTARFDRPLTPDSRLVFCQGPKGDAS